jgi:hypothetical protein
MGMPCLVAVRESFAGNVSCQSTWMIGAPKTFPPVRRAAVCSFLSPIPIFISDSLVRLADSGQEVNVTTQRLLCVVSPYLTYSLDPEKWAFAR